jgi:hypothetical protein
MLICEWLINYLSFTTQISVIAQQPLASQGLLIVEISLSHLETPRSLGLPWMSDQPDAETSTWQYTTQTTMSPARFETAIPESATNLQRLNSRKYKQVSITKFYICCSFLFCFFLILFFPFSSFLAVYCFLILVFHLKQKHEKGERLSHNLQKTNTAFTFVKVRDQDFYESEMKVVQLCVYRAENTNISQRTSY